MCESARIFGEITTKTHDVVTLWDSCKESIKCLWIKYYGAFLPLEDFCSTALMQVTCLYNAFVNLCSRKEITCC